MLPAEFAANLNALGSSVVYHQQFDNQVVCQAVVQITADISGGPAGMDFYEQAQWATFLVSCADVTRPVPGTDTIEYDGASWAVERYEPAPQGVGWLVYASTDQRGRM